MAKDYDIEPLPEAGKDRLALREIARLMARSDTGADPATGSDNGRAAANEAASPQPPAGGAERAQEEAQEYVAAARILDPVNGAFALCRGSETLYANECFALALGYSGPAEFLSAGGIGAAFPGLPLPPRRKGAKGGSEKVEAVTRSGRRVSVPLCIHFPPAQEGAEDGFYLLEIYPSPLTRKIAARALAALSRPRAEHDVAEAAAGDETGSEVTVRIVTDEAESGGAECGRHTAAEAPLVPAGRSSPVKPDEHLAQVEIRHREREVSIGPGAQEAEEQEKPAGKKAGEDKRGTQRGRRAKNGAAARLVESDLLAKISLELRAPLNSIIGFAELMKDKRLGEIDNPHYESYIRDIHDSGKLTLSLIEDLLVIARARAGALELDVAPVDLGELAAQAVEANQALAQERRVFLRLAPCNGLPPVLAERESLARAVNILLAGALRASPPGGQVIISLRRKRSGALRLRVHDNGEPLSGKELARALDPFAYSETTPIARSGNGLALPLAKALAQANGAKFKLKSSPRKGTRADLIFPADRLVPS